MCLDGTILVSRASICQGIILTGPYLPHSAFIHSHNLYTYLPGSMKPQIIPLVCLLYALPARAFVTIYEGAGFGTYYYDIEHVSSCGNNFALQNTGLVECSQTKALSLGQIGSEYLVAMNHSQLAGNMTKYCGKRVLVSVNGVPSKLPLFIGDGCQRCATGSASSDVWDPYGAPGLDFSYSVLSNLSVNACADGHVHIDWEIVDDTLYDFDTYEPPEGSVDQPRSTIAPTATTATSFTPALGTTSKGDNSLAATPSKTTSNLQTREVSRPSNRGSSGADLLPCGQASWTSPSVV